MSSPFLRCLAVLFCFGLGVNAAAGFLQGEETGNRTEKPSELREVHGVRPELVRECSEASDRIMAAFREGAQMSSRDTRVMRACRVAFAASDINLLAASPLPGYAKRIRPEHFQTAKEASGEVLAKFDEYSGDVTFGGSTLRKLDIFQTAITAADTFDKLASPKHTKNVTPEVIGRATQAAERILLEFDQQGYEADFKNEDEEALREFLKATKKE